MTGLPDQLTITARRGMPLPAGLVDKLLQQIQAAVRTYWGGQDQPLKSASLLVAMQLVKDPVTTVDGRPIADIQVRLQSANVYSARVVYGANVYVSRSTAHITLQVAGAHTGERVARAFCDSTEQFAIRRILIHEITHALDVSGVGGVDPVRDPAGYINSESELKAYAGEVWHHIVENSWWYSGDEAKVKRGGETVLWEIIAEILTPAAMNLIREHLGPAGRKYLLGVTYKALEETWPSTEALKQAALKRANENGITKADLQRIRPILREWVAGGWTDGPQLMRLLEKHKDILAKFRLNKPVRLWRNERIKPSRDDGWDHMSNGWGDQYTRPTAWSMERMSAETYASGPGRRLVTAIVSPEDTYCCIPLVDHAAHAMGMKTFDPYRQQEVIVRPNPSFLDQIRPKVSSGEEAQLRQDFERALLDHHLPQLQEMRKTNPRVISDEELKGRVADLAKHKEIHDVRDELAQLRQGKAASTQPRSPLLRRFPSKLEGRSL